MSSDNQNSSTPNLNANAQTPAQVSNNKENFNINNNESMSRSQPIIPQNQQYQEFINQPIPINQQNPQFIPTNPNLLNQPSYNIPQEFGNLQVPIPNQYVQQMPIAGNIPQMPVQNLYNQIPILGAMPAQIPIQGNQMAPAELQNYGMVPIVQDPNIWHNQQEVAHQQRYIDRKNLFHKYVYLCKYDPANMDRQCHYLNTLCSTTHLVALTGIYFSSKYERFLFREGKNHLAASVLFLFANYFLYKTYNKYFLRRSFEKKYREVDDENLENIIRSLEEYRVKAH